MQTFVPESKSDFDSIAEVPLDEVVYRRCKALHKGNPFVRRKEEKRAVFFFLLTTKEKKNQSRQAYAERPYLQRCSTMD